MERADTAMGGLADWSLGAPSHIHPTVSTRIPTVSFTLKSAKPRPALRRTYLPDSLGSSNRGLHKTGEAASTLLTSLGHRRSRREVRRGEPFEGGEGSDRESTGTRGLIRRLGTIPTSREVAGESAH